MKPRHQTLAKSMERIMDRIESMEREPQWDNQQAPPFRNPNFRKNQNPNVGRAGLDQNIRPPFQENYADEEADILEDLEENKINLLIHLVEEYTSCIL